MSFDPSTAALAEPPATPSGFDPSTASMTFDASTAMPASAEDRLKTFSPIIATGKATPTDEADYRKAYHDYYENNTVGSRLTKTLADIHPSEWAGSLMGIARSIGQWHQAINSGGPQNQEITAKVIQRIGQGAKSGLKDVAYFAMNVGAGAVEQLGAAIGEIKHDPKAIDEAASIAINRLKGQASQAADTANPYTDPAERAQFEAGRFIGNLAAPTPAIGKAGELTRVAGDVVEKAGNVALGVAAKAAPPLIKTGEAIAGVAGAVAHPGVAASVVGGKMLGEALGRGGAMAVPFQILREGNAVQKGMFKAADAFGNTVIATPVGQSFIEQAANQAPQLMAQAKAAKIGTNLEVSRLKAMLADAIDRSEPQGKIRAALSQAQAVDRSTEVYQSLLERGTDVAKWMQQNGSAQIPSKLADAMTGAAGGAVFGVTAGNLSGAQDSNPAAAQGAAIGTFLGLLGGSTYASQNTQAPNATPQTNLRRTANAQATIQVPPYVPPTNSGAMHSPTQTPYSVSGVAMRIPTPPVAGELYNPQLNLPSSNPILIGEKLPVDAATLAMNLNNATVAHIEAVRDKLPTETFNFKTMKAVGSEGYDFIMPSDQLLLKLSKAAQPIESSLFDRVAYDPDTQTALVRVQPGKGGRDNVRSYAIPGMTPEKFDAFAKGVNFDGSIGKYFNKNIKPFENHLRIYDNLWEHEKLSKPATPLPPQVSEFLKSKSSNN